LVNYGHLIVEIEARKKKEVDYEQGGSRRVEGEILHEAAVICESSDAELFKHWSPCLRAFARTSISGLSVGVSSSDTPTPVHYQWSRDITVDRQPCS
jgi:hypothetical protein